MNKEKKKYDSEIIGNSKVKHSDSEIKKKSNLKEKISIHPKKSINNKEIIFDTAVDITIELGRSKIKLKELLNFEKGSMLFLNQRKEDPLKILANGTLVALGEIVMSENKYGIRIISIKNS